MKQKLYPCDDSRKWYEWEARLWDEYKLMKHGDLEDLEWQEYERCRMAREDADCGYVTETKEDETE